MCIYIFALVTQHANLIYYAPYYDVICGCLPVPCFSTLYHTRQDFFYIKKGVLSNKCVFWCTLTTFFWKSHILRRTARYGRRYSCKVYFFLFYSNKSWLFSTYIRNFLKLQIQWKSDLGKLGCSLRTDGQIERQRDMMEQGGKLFTIGK